MLVKRAPVTVDEILLIWTLTYKAPGGRHKVEIMHINIPDIGGRTSSDDYYDPLPRKKTSQASSFTMYLLMLLKRSYRSACS